MRRTETPVARDSENPDPQELNKPVPRVILALVFVLLAWAVYYIAHQSPGMRSSSTATPTTSSGRTG